MAKAEHIPIAPDEPYRRAGARIVRVRARELFEHAEGVLDMTDPEGVHAMRVATRRLRAVLEIFAPCFPKAEFRGVLRDVKQLADVLGERRDPDVQIVALEAFAAGVTPAHRPGIRRMIEDFRVRQSAANERLADELARVERRGLHGRLIALADAADPEPDADAPPVDAEDPA